MTITIKCDCGNNVIVETLPKKYSQFRDELNEKHFYYEVTDMKDSRLNELLVGCKVCKNWITLGLD